MRLLGQKQRTVLDIALQMVLVISIFVSVSFASQFHKDKEDWLGWMTSLIMGCVLGKESEHKQAYLILQRENYFYYTRQ